MLEAVTKWRPGEVRDNRSGRLETVVECQQSVAPERYDGCLLLYLSTVEARVFGPSRCPFVHALGDALAANAMTVSKRGHGLLAG